MALVDRQQILRRLKGQRICLPDLYPIFVDWPRGVNRNRKRLNTVVNEKLASLVQDETKLAKLKKADFALFASSWWPYASFDELRILVYLTIWLFLWDDEIDESTGALTNDFEGSVAHRSETIIFIEHTLGLRIHHPHEISVHPLITSFCAIGDELRAQYTIRQRKLFMKEIVFFMNMSEHEQRVRLAGKIPSTEEYWEYRMGTSAVGICLAVIDFAHQMRLPPRTFRGPEMQIIRDEANRIISITNDMLSVQKELALGCIDSLIPISCASNPSAQSVIDNAVLDLRACVTRFDNAAERLTLRWCSPEHPHANFQRRKISRKVVMKGSTSRAMLSLPPKPHHNHATRSQILTPAHLRALGDESSRTELADQLWKFINACRQNCVGNLTWSLATDRYGHGKTCRDKRQGFELVL